MSRQWGSAERLFELLLVQTRVRNFLWILQSVFTTLVGSSSRSSQNLDQDPICAEMT
jgi:hypothetical protein